jgi:transcriptional regulator with XRE-family HTH domain
MIGEQLRSIRERKRLTQEDIVERTGLSQAYVSRVENGDAIPSEETVEKWARALEVEVNQILGIEPPALSNLTNRLTADDIVRGSSRKLAGLATEKRRA